jgi:nucleoside 2-deoxyribosyltransferase
MIKVYMASKMEHAEKWRELYSEHPTLHVVSRWPFLEPFVSPTGENAKKFWQDDVADIAHADAVVVFAKEGEKLRGALVEAGIAIGMGKLVVVIGEHLDYGTWRFHPQVFNATTIEEAFSLIEKQING